MKIDPLAGLATAIAPGKKKPASKAVKKGTPQARVPVPQKTQGAPKPVPQNFSPIRNARS